jgi:hypothetical protein
MVDHFLKLGGVKSLKDFYKKFPTEAHFDQHMHQMQYGGGINAYAKGGVYKGNSIIDYFNSKGLSSDMASRAKYAKIAGMSNYTGTADQNDSLLRLLKQSDKPESSQQGHVLPDNLKITTPTAPTFRPALGIQGSYNSPVKVTTPVKKTAKTPVKTAASTNNFQRYPGRGTSLELDYNNYEGRPDQAITTSTKSATKKAKVDTSQAYVNKTFSGNNPLINGFQQVAANSTSSAVAPAASFFTSLIKQYNLGAKAKAIVGTEADARNLESGMIEDKNKGLMYVIKGNKVVKTFPILTGLNKDGNENNLTLTEMEKLEKTNPTAAAKQRTTPVGTYISKPADPANMYGKKGFYMNPISAFGEAAPKANPGLAQHVIYPPEKAIRTKIMCGPGEKRVGSYGCTNLFGNDIDYLTGQAFPQGDTTIVVDSRRGKDKNFLKNKYNIQKMGGQPCYNCGGMYDQGGIYDNGRAIVNREATDPYGTRGIVNRGPYDSRGLVNAYGHGGYYGNVPQHGNPGTYDGYSGTSSGGQYFGDGGSFIPEYGDSAYGQLPQYEYGKAMYGAGMAYGGAYDDGGMAPEEQAAMQQAQGQQQGPPQGGGMDPQQVMQGIAQMLQQGAQPEEIMQQLVQMGIPQEQAQQMIQQVMQQMQGGQQQEAPPQGRYGGKFYEGGFATTDTTTNYISSGLDPSKNWPSTTAITRPNANIANNVHTQTDNDYADYVNNIPITDGVLTPAQKEKYRKLNLPFREAMNFIQQDMFTNTLTPAQLENYNIAQQYKRKENERRGIRVNKYGGQQMANGGLVKGSEHEMSEHDIQNLINQGYKIQYL